MTTIYENIRDENRVMSEKLDLLVETILANGDTFPDSEWIIESHINRELLIDAIANDYPVLAEYSSLGQYLFLVRLYARLGYEINIV
jgi:hypothetical protein